MICSIIPLRSLAGPGGAFDTAKVKCPPDRGSSECVTGRPAPYTPPSPLSSSPDSYYSPHPKQAPIFDSLHRKTPNITSINPCAIPARSASTISTPPLTPDDGSDYSDRCESPYASTQQQKDALDFLMTLFPGGLKALPYAKSINISAPNLGSAFNGMVLDLPGRSRTLYVDAKNAESVSLRESIVALLDLADEHLECSALVIVLERSSPSLGELLHSLMYVGGSVVTKPPFPVNSAFVLVGLEI